MSIFDKIGVAVALASDVPVLISFVSTNLPKIKADALTILATVKAPALSAKTAAEAVFASGVTTDQRLASLEALGLAVEAMVPTLSNAQTAAVAAYKDIVAQIMPILLKLKSDIAPLTA